MFIFCSRISFTFLGAPIEAFFIDAILSVELRTVQQNTSFAKLNKQPIVSSFINSYRRDHLLITYAVKRDSKTFDFSVLPYGLLNAQLVLFKEEEEVGILEKCTYDGWFLRAAAHNRPTIITIRFLAVKSLLNTFV